MGRDIAMNLLSKANLGTLKLACFKFDIDFENISGESKIEKIIGLIEHLERREKIEKFLELVNIEINTVINLIDKKIALTELLEQSKIEELIDCLGQISGSFDEDFKSGLSVVSARFNKLKKDKLMGVIRNEDENLEYNRINQALISLIGKIK